MILKMPFTKIGEIRYFELFKIVSFVMAFIMGISYLLNLINLPKSGIVLGVFYGYMTVMAM